MQVVFLGTPIWAAAYLPAIQQAGSEIAVVISQPDRARSRGRKVQPTPVKQAALEMGIAVLQPEQVNSEEALAQIGATEPDVLLTVAYGQILGKRLLALPRLAALNVHYSLLPQLRGPAPVQHALLQGMAQTGVTLQEMAEEVDAGDILVQEAAAIGPDDNADTLCRKLTEVGTGMVTAALPQIAAGELLGRPQNHAEATYAPLLTKADMQLDFTRSAEAVRNRIRAFAPRPGAYCLLGDRRLKITVAEIVNDSCEAAGEPGTIVEIDSDSGPLVRTGEGLLLVRRVQPEGRREMSAVEWLRGARVEAGTLLSYC